MSKTTYESLDNKIAASTLTKDLTKGLDVVDGHRIKKPGEYENPDELYDMYQKGRITANDFRAKMGLPMVKNAEKFMKRSFLVQELNIPEE